MPKKSIIPKLVPITKLVPFCEFLPYFVWGFVVLAHGMSVVVIVLYDIFYVVECSCRICCIVAIQFTHNYPYW